MNPERLLLLLPLVMLVDRAALFRNIATPRDPLEYYVGEDALFNWTKSDGQKIHSASWGIEKQNMPDPFFIHINVYTKKVNLNKDTDQKYINRVYFVGNLTEGRAWFMLKNVTISDTNKYIAVIRDNEHGVLHSTVKMEIKSKDGLVWKDAPDEVVNVQQGSNITLRWHYELEDNEKFFCSRLVSNHSKSYSLAFRQKGESCYNNLSGKNQTKFTITGKNDVNLTIFSAELGPGNSGYCCIVIWDSNKGRMQEERCTTIHIYDPPRITSHTPQLYCKQGDQVKLQCNATGYPEPRVRWMHRDTKKIIGSLSVTSLNITGKRSEGSYCCDVKNQFGRETACTTVKVTEYKPENTAVVHWVSNNTLYIKCNATASPPPNYFLIRINEEQYNSTNVINTFRYISTQNNTVSCTPFNKYGQGPMEKINLPVYVMTQRNCTSECNKEIITKEKKNLPLIVGISCGIPIAICCLTVAVVIYWRKRKGITPQDKKLTDEDPHAAPLDNLVQSTEVLLPKKGWLF